MKDLIDYIYCLGQGRCCEWILIWAWDQDKDENLQANYILATFPNYFPMSMYLLKVLDPTR